MIKIMPYLLVSNAKDAISLYEEVFDANLIEHKPFTPEIVKKMNMQDIDNYENSTMHAIIEIGGSILYLADNNQKTKDYGHVEITLELESEQQIKKFYDRLISNEALTYMELNNNFGSWYARIMDKFGVVWQLNYIQTNNK